MILIIGDVHWKAQKPYKEKLSEMFNYIYEKYGFCTLVFTGDFFDTSNPHSEEVVDLALAHLMKFKAVHIVTGNHELSSRNGNPLIPLSHIPKVHVYTKPQEVKIEEYYFLMLPYLYNVKEMKKEYEALRNNVDVVVSHVAYPGTNFGSPDEVDLSGITAKHYIYGHIHSSLDFPNNHYVLGVPSSTRYGEQEWNKRIAKLDNISEDIIFDPFPDFVTFEDIIFGSDPYSKDSIINVSEAPSVKAVLDKYKGYNIRLQGIKLVDTEKEVTYSEQKDNLNFSLESNFQGFSEGQTIRGEVKAKIQELFGLVPS